MERSSRSTRPFKAISAFSRANCSRFIETALVLVRCFRKLLFAVSRRRRYMARYPYSRCFASSMFTILSLTWDRPRRYHKEEISLSKKGTQREKLILSSGTIVTTSEPMYTPLVQPDFTVNPILRGTGSCVRGAIQYQFFVWSGPVEAVFEGILFLLRQRVCICLCKYRVFTET